MPNLLDDFETVTEAKYLSNRDVRINHIDSIRIVKFRSFKDRLIRLGNYITIIVGRNATMKTSLLGLIAHPFGSDAKDCFGKPLKTELSQVFKLSFKYDKEYEYEVRLIDSKNNKIFSPVCIYKRSSVLQKGFRVVVGKKHQKGEGNFKYNTSYMSFSRMTPIVETNAANDINVKLTGQELSDLVHFYRRILPSKIYNSFEAIKDKKNKETFGPYGDKTVYDFNGISSGEDNLGAIFNKMIAFQRFSESDRLVGNGILCIDEIEAGLHPSAQFALFKYLYEWAQKYRVQVVFTTHSIYLIERIYREYKESMNRNSIGINFISCSEADDDKNYPILYNPEYNRAYKELTLQTPEQVVSSHKIKVLCEDVRAEAFIKYLLADENIISKLNFITDRTNGKKGTSWSALKQVLKTICNTFPVLLPDAFVIFDADVPNLADCDPTKFVILPDKNSFPIEKRLAIFIIEANNSDDMFKRFDKEQTAFLSDLADSGIPTSTTEIKASIHIEPFKKWANKESLFDNIMREYVNRLVEEKTTFRENVLERMNGIYSSLGLPCISKPTSWYS